MTAETGLLPPRYVNVSATVTYSAEVSDPHFRTYARLVGLAWQDRRHDHTQVPVISLADLATVCHLKERQMRNHLNALADQGLIRLRGDSRAYRIQILDPRVQNSAVAVQSFAPPALETLASHHNPYQGDDDGDIDDDQLETEQQQTTSSGTAVQTSALTPRERANLEALQAFGVNPQVAEAQKVAALPHVTPDVIQAWGRELQQRENVRNLPGLLLYTLSTHQHPPQPEKRGGNRKVSPILPEEVQKKLARLNWSGPQAEVAARYQERPAFVEAWLDYCLAHVQDQQNPAGFFRHAIRGETEPPQPAFSVPEPDPEVFKSSPKPPEVQLWTKILSELELQMTRATFDTWLRGSECLGYPDEDEQILVVRVRNEKAIAWLESKLQPVVERAVRYTTAKPLRVQFTTASDIKSVMVQQALIEEVKP
jgi:hypothetical protein